MQETNNITIKARVAYNKKEVIPNLEGINQTFEILKNIFIEKVYPHIEDSILEKIKILDEVLQLSNYTIEFTFNNGKKMDFYFSIFSKGQLITKISPSKEQLKNLPIDRVPFGIEAFRFEQQAFIQNELIPYCENILNHNKNIKMVIDNELYEFLKYSFCDQRIIKKSEEFFKFYKNILRNEEFKLANQVFEDIQPVIKLSGGKLYLELFISAYERKIDLLAKEKFKTQSDKETYINLVKSCPPCDNFEKMLIAAFYINLTLSDEAFRHFLSNQDATLIELVRLDKLLGY